MVCYVCGNKDTVQNGHIKLENKKEPQKFMIYELCADCLQKQSTLFSKMKKSEEKKPTPENCFLCGKEGPTNKMSVGSNACILCQDCMDSFILKLGKIHKKNFGAGSHA